MGMSQEIFVKRYQGVWFDFEDMLDRIESNKLDRPVDHFPELYRKVCRHLAVAQSRGYSPAVRDRLDKMVQRGHTILYRRSRKGPARQVWAYAAGGFAVDVRRNWRFLAVATMVFVLPFLVMMGWVANSPQVAVEVLGHQQLQEMDAMYGSADTSRDAADDVVMFAFYIYNNVGIALRTFGSGLIFGIGSLFIMLFNGVFIGTAAGHVIAAGHGEQFWPFVIGHGSFELTAIVLAGMAGLKIGTAPIWPGRRGRIDAIRHAARDSVGIIVGFTIMLFIAAFIEAFWSPRDVEPMVRYIVGAGLWAFVLSYLAFAGRGYESR